MELFKIPLARDEERQLYRHSIMTALSEGSGLVSNGANIAFNLSPKKLGDADFVKDLFNACSTYGLRHDSVVLEITEDEQLDACEQAMKSILFLQANGFKISLDDFGARHSTFKQLLLLPFDEIKVDKFFALQAIDNSDALAVIESVIAFGNKTGKTIVIEGIENEEIHHLVCSKGATHGQGYFYGLPLPFDKIITDGKRDEIC